MSYAILTKSLDELQQIMKLPNDFTLVSVQFDMRHGTISFLVESSRLPEKDKEETMSSRGHATMDVTYRVERISSDIDFTRVTPLIFVDGQQIQ